MSLNHITIYIFSLMIALSLLIHISRKENVYKGSYNYYRAVIISTILLTVLEVFSWVFDGYRSGFAYGANVFFNYLLHGLSGLPLTLWFLYFDYRIYYKKAVLKKRHFIYVSVNIVILILVTINLFKPFLYNLNNSNEFVGLKGTLYIGIIQVMYLLLYVAFVLLRRKHVHNRVLKSIFVLMVAPFFAIILQVYLGMTTIWPMMVYVTFYVFLMIERDEMAKDPLTGLSLRKQFESRVISLLKRDREFALLMMDLDNFKAINDNHGHNKGDEVLYDFGQILQGAIHKVDTVYRYAGDEFIILIEDINKTSLPAIIDKIEMGISSYNRMSTLKTDLSMSYGTSKIVNTDQSLQDIISHVDKLMYENKKKKQ